MIEKNCTDKDGFRINDALDLVNHAIEVNPGVVGTHYEGCYAWHAPCLAQYIKDILTGE